MNLPPDVRSAIGQDERVLFAVRPGFLSVVAMSWKTLLGLTVVGALFFLPWIDWRWGPLLSALAAIARLGWGVAVWWNICAVLTDRRVCIGFGVFRRGVVTLELSRVQHIALSRLLVERLLGLGTIAIASAGTGSPEVYWPMLNTPKEVLAMLRETIAGMSDTKPRAPGVGDGI